MRLKGSIQGLQRRQLSRVRQMMIDLEVTYETYFLNRKPKITQFSTWRISFVLPKSHMGSQLKTYSVNSNCMLVESADLKYNKCRMHIQEWLGRKTSKLTNYAMKKLDVGQHCPVEETDQTIKDNRCLVVKYSHWKNKKIIWYILDRELQKKHSEMKTVMLLLEKKPVLNELFYSD